MHDQRTPPAERDPDDADRSILALLTDEPGLWTVGEIERHVGNRVTAVDGVNRLYAAGLIYRLDRFVFATRAALRGQRLAL